MTKPIFSESYYQDNYLFSYPQQNYATLGTQATFATTPAPVCCSPKRSLLFQRNPDSLALNQRLYELYTQVKEKKGVIFEALKTEVHYHGVRGYLNLKENLTQLNNHFTHANLPRAILKVINLFRSCFGLTPLTPTPYKTIDMAIFDQNIQETILADNPSSISSVVITKGSCPDLNPKALHQLKIGLISNIPIQSGADRFLLEFSKGQFSLYFEQSEREPEWFRLPGKMTRILHYYHDRVDTVIQETLNGKTHDIPIWYAFEYYTGLVGQITHSGFTDNRRHALKPGATYNLGKVSFRIS
jgi:hypothetical protein